MLLHWLIKLSLHLFRHLRLLWETQRALKWNNRNGLKQNDPNGPETEPLILSPALPLLPVPSSTELMVSKPNDVSLDPMNISAGSEPETSSESMAFPISLPVFLSTQKKETLSAPPLASIEGKRVIPAPTPPRWNQQFVLRTYPNGGQEVIDTTEGVRKITYGLRFEGAKKLTFDAHETIWMNREGRVLAVQTYDGLMRRYEGGDLCYTLPIDMVALKKPTIEAERYLLKARTK